MAQDAAKGQGEWMLRLLRLLRISAHIMQQHCDVYNRGNPSYDVA